MRSAGGLSEPGMRLTSPAFEDGEAIPPDHTCTGRDRSPALAWAELPASTRSLALIVDDPDAPRGTFTHWLAWGIDPAAGGLAEGERPPREGRNDFGTVGYRGPCPPRGHGPHRYRFRLHALDAELDAPGGDTRDRLEAALARHVLTVAELVGRFERG
jgi:Raf kinase inhibitor-like YbhB/YbcL family protein